MVVIFVPRESEPGETRVSGTPGTVKMMVGHGHEVRVQKDAGLPAGFPDALFEEAGAISLVTGKFRSKPLDCHDPAQLQILGPVNLTHSARTQKLLYLVAISKDTGQLRIHKQRQP